MSEAHEYALSQVVATLNSPIIPNSWRGVYVELVVQFALGKDWSATEEWAGWDLQHEDGTKVEVKQSAVLQTWEAPQYGKKKGSEFSIKAAKGEYRGADWFEGHGRRAGIYVFAYHPLSDRSLTDQRDESQWEFYVVPTCELPQGQKSISIGPLRKLAQPVSFAELGTAVDAVRNNLKRPS